MNLDIYDSRLEEMPLIAFFAAFVTYSNTLLLALLLLLFFGNGSFELVRHETHRD